MKKYIYILIGTALLAVSCGRTVNPNKAPKTSLDSFSYVIGFNLGNNMKQQGMEKIDYSSFIRGMEEALKKDSGFAIKKEDHSKIAEAFLQKQQQKKLKDDEKKIKGIQAESKKWMDDNAKKGGVTNLDAGGQMRMMVKGNGPSPQIYDTIVYSMVVKNAKGKEMMNSAKMGGDQRHTVKQTGVQVLEEAFQKAAAGAEFEVYIQNDMVPQLSGNAESVEDRFGISIFTFKLIKVIPGKPEPPAKPGATMPPGMK